MNTPSMNNAKRHSINTSLKLKFRNNEAITTVHLAVSLLLLLLTESVLGLFCCNGQVRSCNRFIVTKLKLEPSIDGMFLCIVH